MMDNGQHDDDSSKHHYHHCERLLAGWMGGSYRRRCGVECLTPGDDNGDEYHHHCCEHLLAGWMGVPIDDDEE